MIAAGLMSGTSFDSIDAALVEIVPTQSRYAVRLLRFTSTGYSERVRAMLQAALPPAVPNVVELLDLHAAVGREFGAAVRELMGSEAVDYVASHGQTVYHDGARGLTLQLGDAFVIREHAGVCVVYDFRSADCAAGGHGAPLVPYVDALLFGSDDEDRALLNIGGIANVSFVPRGGAPADVIGFDTGPGNMLLDGFVSRRTSGAQRFDRDGAYAAAGTVDGALIADMLAHPYFSAAPPKSTGRETFGETFLSHHADALARLSLEDGCATLCALTARSVADAVQRTALPKMLIVSGGGAQNPSIMRMLAESLRGVTVCTSDRFGVPVDAKEAIAFAVLGYETLRGRAAGLPRVTGARHPVVLGAIAPRHLDALLAKIAGETARSAQHE